MQAIDKLRKIVEWADSQDEHFNGTFQTVSDIEKAYDYCQNPENGTSYLDFQALQSIDKQDAKKAISFLKKLNKNKRQ